MNKKLKFILSIIFILSYSYYSEIEATIALFIITIFVSSISQIGDIIISYFKRLSKIKNTGNIIPGHGGLLDRIDGMIFSFPIFYLISFTDYFN